MLSRVHRILRRTGGEPDKASAPATDEMICRADGRTPAARMSDDRIAVEREGPVEEPGTPVLDAVEALSAEEQSAADLAALLEHDTLDAEQIAEAREHIAALPQSERPAMYRQLAAKVTYRNQRDNEGKHAASDAKSLGYAKPGDVMCNVTSLAMALESLGLGADESKGQFEDQLDEVMVEADLGSRYDQQGQAGAAKAFGADTDRLWTPTFRNGDAARDFFTKNVLPRLEKGEAATLSMTWGPKGQYTHIVRLEWVESDGLVVDDPFGALGYNGQHFTYEENAADSAQGDGARGEDGQWSWDTVAGVNSGRYVQFHTKS